MTALSLLLPPICLLVGLYAGAWLGQRLRLGLAPLPQIKLPSINILRHQPKEQPETKAKYPKMTA